MRFLSGTQADVRAEVRRLAKLFPLASPVRHVIRVIVPPHPAVQAPDGMTGFGVCRVPKRAADPVLIAVAGGLADEYLTHGGTREEAVRAVGECFLHELAHYEQIRDGRPVREAGVTIRARGLYRQIDALEG